MTDLTWKQLSMFTDEELGISTPAEKPVEKTVEERLEYLEQLIQLQANMMFAQKDLLDLVIHVLGEKGYLPKIKEQDVESSKSEG